jgi:hypothetical protein
MTKQDNKQSPPSCRTYFCVVHSIDRGHRYDRKGVGTFTDISKARAAIARVSSKPGFRKSLDGFRIAECDIGMMYLPGGYDHTTAAPSIVDGVATISSEDVVWQASAVSVRDDEEYDDDFILVGLFATRADASSALVPIARMVDETKYRLEIHECYIDRVEWSEGFGFE